MWLCDACSLEAVLPVLFKCYGSIIGQGPPGFSLSSAKVSKSRGFTHGHLRLRSSAMNNPFDIQHNLTFF